MRCDNCNMEHDGSYGSKRFCSQRCQKGFSTKAKRKEINEKVSITLKKVYATPENRKLCINRIVRSGVSPLANYSEEDKKAVYTKQVASLKATNEARKAQLQKDLPFEEWKKSWIYEHMFKVVGYKCEQCGYEYFDETIQRGPYEIHHKDGNNKNWKRNNLQILCLICHWKTGNWRMRGKTHSKETKEKLSKITTLHYRKKKEQNIF